MGILKETKSEFKKMDKRNLWGNDKIQKWKAGGNYKISELKIVKSELFMKYLKSVSDRNVRQLNVLMWTPKFVFTMNNDRIRLHLL